MCAIMVSRMQKYRVRTPTYTAVVVYAVYSSMTKRAENKQPNLSICSVS